MDLLRKWVDAMNKIIEFDDDTSFLDYGNDGIMSHATNQPAIEPNAIREREEVKRELQGRTQQGGSSSAPAILKSFIHYETVAEALQTAQFGPTDRLPQSDETFSDAARHRLNCCDFLDQDKDLFTQELFSGLRHQLSCCDNSHAARLELAQFLHTTEKESKTTSELYLSASAKKNPRCWFETRLTDVECNTSYADAGCGILADAEKGNQILKLVMAKDTHSPPIRYRIGPERSSEDRPTRSLERLLEQGALLRAERAHINRELAAWLLRMSSEAFRCITLHASNVYFLYDPATGRVNRRQPYFSWDVSAYRMTVEDTGVNDFKAFDFETRLLHFARLILEVDSGKVIPTGDSPTALLESVKRHRNNEVKKDSLIWDVVQSCLDPATKASRLTNDVALKAWIFNQLVQRLQKEFVGWARPVDESQDIGVFSSGNEPFYEATTWPVDNISKGTEESAEEFMKHMDFFVRRHVDPVAMVYPSPYPPHRVKIAIIDSGIKRGDKHLLGAMGNKVKDCRNFSTCDPDDWDDNVGHGTSIACLLMDVAPCADLYIAKVTDSVKMGRHHRNCIAKGIQWAVQKWEVDIISMSICLPEKHEGIQVELEEACNPSSDHSTRKIVFAAAGNQGGNSPLAWPASEDNANIIAISATDGLGNNTGTNPNPFRHTENFGTLGCDIRSPGWPFQLESDVYLTGSSFATPIAAGIAANVLEFARHRLKLTPDQKTRLYGGPCMRRVFRKMAMPNDDGGQNNRSDLTYVQPWTWWGSGSVINKDYKICEDLKAIIRDC